MLNGEVIVKLYSAPEHYEHMCTLFALRDLNPINLMNLPRLGTIAFFEGRVVAACFVREVEGNFGLLDGFVTNPHEPSEVRNAAIVEGMALLIEIAKELKYLRLILHSKDAGTLTRLESAGFRLCEHKVGILTLWKD